MISIIVPVYNSSLYLEECYNSITAQTFQDYEIIFVNDGSTDDSDKLLSAFRDKDSRVSIINQNNKGVSVARNRGLEVCKGEYISFVDSDDYLLPEYLELLHQPLLRNEVCLSTCAFTRDPEQVITVPCSEIYYNTEEYLGKRFQENSVNTQLWCMMFKKEIIVDHQLHFTPGCTRGEDFEFIMKYLLHSSRISYTSAPLYFYRVNESSAMYTINEKSLTSLEASSRVINYYETHKHPQRELLHKYCLSYTIWKLLAVSLLNRKYNLYTTIKRKYNCKKEMKKLFEHAKVYVRISSRVFVYCEGLFILTFYLTGFIKK